LASQPPFSKQIHDLEGELGVEFFERQRKGVVLTPAGKSFLIDARRILEDCEASIRKAQRISRGEIGELAIRYMSALTHEFLGKSLEVWRLNCPGITVDCIEMDSVSQERALLEGRISVGILVPSDRPVLELLQVRLLIKYPVFLALPKSHPHANKHEISLSLLKEEPFIGLNRMYPNYGDWLLKVCRKVGFKPRIVKEADGAASALAFVAAGFGVAVVSEPLQKIPAKDVVFRNLARSPGRGCLWAPPGSGIHYPLQSLLNSSTFWLKPAPAEMGNRVPDNSRLNLRSRLFRRLLRSRTAIVFRETSESGAKRDFSKVIHNSACGVSNWLATFRLISAITSCASGYCVGK
jgi:DNA-binding transcriptional LysR family regulator